MTEITNRMPPPLPKPNTNDMTMDKEGERFWRILIASLFSASIATLAIFVMWPIERDNETSPEKLSFKNFIWSVKTIVYVLFYAVGAFFLSWFGVKPLPSARSAAMYIILAIIVAEIVVLLIVNSYIKE